MTSSFDFGGMGVVQYIRGALGFPRLGLWDALRMSILTSDVDFGALFGGTVGLDQAGSG